MIVLRICHHKATPEQVAELRRIYGPKIEIIEHNETVTFEEMFELVRKVSPDVVEVSLDEELVAGLMNVKPEMGLENVPVIKAKMTREFPKGGGKAKFRFRHYEEIEEFRLRKRPL